MRIPRHFVFAVVPALAAMSAQAQCWLPSIGTPGASSTVWATILWDPDGGGGSMQPELVVAGNFTTIGGVAANRIARWNGTTWSAFGTGLNSTGVALCDTGNGTLVVVGSFTTAGGVTVNRVAQWNGSIWSALGTATAGPDDLVNTVARMPNNDIVVGGRFSNIGGVAANRVARWNGSTWAPLGAGVGGTPPFYVNSLLPTISGDLYVGGFFSTAGGGAANNIALYSNAGTWSAVGVGFLGPVNAMTFYGGQLIAGGQYTNSGATFVNHIARWSGSAWLPLGTGMNPVAGNLVKTLHVLPSGDLIAGGIFQSATGTPASNIARWNGTNWTALGAGTNALVYGLTTLTDQTLVVGGDFTNAGGSAVSRLARYATGNALAFSVQPQTLAVCTSQTAIFNTAANGNPPVTLRWQHEFPAGTWTDLADGNVAGIGTVVGSGSTILSVSNFGTNAGGGYRCVASNPCGSVTGNPAQLFVDPSDLGVQGGTPGRDGQHDNNDFVVFINYFFTADSHADLGSQGGILGADGMYDNNDFVAFINQFFAGC